MIQKVQQLKKCKYGIQLIGSLTCFVSFNQTKRVERDAVSSSESEDDKEDKITVAYKSTRSAVSLKCFSYVELYFKCLNVKIMEYKQTNLNF